MDHDEIVAALARQTAVLESIDHALNGNGQQGFIEKTNERLGNLEKTEARAKGALAVVWAALTATGGTLVAHLFHGWKG